MPDRISEIIHQQSVFFKSHYTLDIQHRLNSLKKLRKSIQAFEPQIIRALYEDLGKSEFEAYSSEVGMVLKELSSHIKNLKKWAKQEKVRTPLIAFPSKSFIQKQPYGKVLVISPFNYPFMLAMIPLIGAVSAGNVVVLKPSEFTKHTSLAVEKIINDTFPEKHVAVIQGGVLESQRLLENRWDKIFFTGSTRVGKIVMEAASKNLTPVTLELGGKNPVVVDKDANLRVAAKRIIWGKLLNSGQTCIAPDYLFVHKDIETEFLNELKQAIEKFVSENAELCSDYPKIINKDAVNRLHRLLKDVTIYYGGQFKIDQHHFSPTILTDVNPDSEVMQDEIFGPILPVMRFSDLAEVIDFMNKKEKPLAAYYFSENRRNQKLFLQQTYSGDSGINEVVMHFTNLSLPFGGVGLSGMGSYHGKRSFEIFSHQRSVIKTTTKIDLPLRYPPYKNSILKLLRKVLK